MLETAIKDLVPRVVRGRPLLIRETRHDQIRLVRGEDHPIEPVDVEVVVGVGTGDVVKHACE